jgi:aminopyrrolnitrin oxygenase
LDAADLKKKTDLPWRVSNDLASWYLVAAGSELAEGTAMSASVGLAEVVLFRSEGQVHALDPYCAHMGAKLCHGSVSNGMLTCPLHGWKYKGDGNVAGGRNRIRSWPVVERMGGILVFNGSEPLFEPPEEQPRFRWGATSSGVIDAPWFALTANAFDTHHYEAVHRRRLKEAPETTKPDRWTFQCSYLSEVTGSEFSDRLMRWLAPNGIKVTMKCYGGVLFTVHSVLGQRQASLMVGMEPRGNQTRLRLMVGSQKPGLQAAMARYLYTSFLKSDLEPMTGVRLQPHTGLPVDAVIERFARYLESLPVVVR